MAEAGREWALPQLPEHQIVVRFLFSPLGTYLIKPH